MKIYLVGGAVRDKLLGRPVKEKDWVVVGATPDDMRRLGYQQVGKDFPVFLHPKTHEEYALARIERKIGRGYTGFEFDTSSHVTLKEDLLRRDLTINAIAETAEGVLEDPYHGQQDLERKLLRHVSNAFVEDPVRILRVARFAARFSDFTVAPETNALMKTMVSSGEVDALVAERVWKELERALGEANPERFFQVLEECDALPVLFPALSLKSAGMKALQCAVKKTEDSQIRFAALLHDLNLDDARLLCERYRVPGDYKELALLAIKHSDLYVENVKQTSAALSVKLMQEVDAFRREARFRKLLRVFDSIFGDEKFSHRLLEIVLPAAKNIDAKKLSQQFSGKELPERIFQARVDAVKKIL